MDILILQDKHRRLQAEREVLMISQMVEQMSHQRESKKIEQQLERLQREIDVIAPDLYWARLSELIHTPCFIYRV